MFEGRFEELHNLGYMKMVEECLDIFDDWYEESIKLPEDVSCEFIGDITKRVRRNMGIDKIL